MGNARPFGPPTASVTDGRNQTVRIIQIVLRDDSPEDGGGFVFFPAGSDIIITYVDGRVDRGKDIRFEPIIQGGLVQGDFITANGTEEIRLRYDFDSPAFVALASGPRKEIAKVEFRLVLGNDYQVWATSDRQLNYLGEAVLLLVAQAEGNVRDNTNMREVSFEYGLPTGIRLLGGTLEVRDFKGFDLYGEYDLSLSYRKYPNRGKDIPATASGIRGRRSAPAWMVNVSKRAHSFFFFGEAYSMDPRYNTRILATRDELFIDYNSDSTYVELVEDNDDQDRFPDPVRSGWSGDSWVFPLLDENNDFISDFNQNDSEDRPNRLPDYEEPFLRHHVDRPEFIFGVDLNNNAWGDRFENDDLPDYPYKKNHRGYNAYGGAYITPEIQLAVGMLRENLISSNQKNHTTYALLTIDRDMSTWGRFRLYEMIKSIEDDIRDDLLWWHDQRQQVEDPLIARDTWVNSLWIGHDYKLHGVLTTNYLKYDFYHQRLGKDVLLDRRKRAFFFGLINKVSYRLDLGRLWVEPRWKSEYHHQNLELTSTEKRTEWVEVGGFIVGLPLLSHTTLQGGVELSFTNDERQRHYFIGQRQRHYFIGRVWALQFSNRCDCLGYTIFTRAGVVNEHWQYPTAAAISPRVTSFFISIYAGLE